ncbi:holotricin-3 [Parvibacter caecicola]|uniref:Holotricin-3 n=1 Tax=Parvibacter caecicola TaxID=747645 RepID=A0A4T9T8W9_9ACTN|nr:holotricin-3 [Parvibacter caecicola]
MFKDENGRSYGDWTHRDQRTREEANRIVKDPNEKKWYDQNFYIIMFLLLFWPVGIVLCWRSSWPLAAKIVVSILLVAMVVALAMNYNATVAALG